VEKNAVFPNEVTVESKKELLSSLIES
jgi:hypothetical protein